MLIPDIIESHILDDQSNYTSANLVNNYVKKHAMTVAAGMDSLQAALVGLRYAYPAVIFFYFALTTAVSIFTLQTVQTTFKHPRRSFICYLMVFVAISYLAQVANVVVPSISDQSWLKQEDTTVTLLGCFLVFGLLAANVLDNPTPVWYPYIGSYTLALLFDPAIEVLSIFTHGLKDLEWLLLRINLCVVLTRSTAIVLLLSLYFVGRERTIRPESTSDPEREPLLPKKKLASSSEESGETEESQASSSNTTTNGEAPEPAIEEEDEWAKKQREERERQEKRLRESGNWYTYAKDFRIFFPYVWPVQNRTLQLRAVLTGVCLMGVNALNVLIPYQFGVLTDSLSQSNESSPWIQFIIFAVLKVADSEAGIRLLREWLWLPLKCYTEESLATATFSHVMRLSSDFHDAKNSMNISYDMFTGATGVTGLLEIVVLRTLPMTIDLVVAFIYLSIAFGPYLGLIATATSMAFFLTSQRLVRMKQKRQRTARDLDMAAWSITQNNILGWSNVTNFDRVPYEEERQSKAVNNHIRSTITTALIDMASATILCLVLLVGLLTGAWLVIYQVTTGVKTPGKFVMLLAYWAQLTSPLTFFSSLGAQLAGRLVRAERLLKTMLTKPSVVDRDGAWTLKLRGGKVTFDRVGFSYDDKKDILKDISFVALPGTTTAFVGTTGAGKSTILKLINRLYDVKSGSVKIDGQDVRDVNLSSLRSAFGIVPQDTMLFDDTIMTNVRYAKLDATDEEVYEACKAAAIHDDIVGFPEGYHKRVGERGTRLSGGQIQRIAVARAILKRPAIVILDEASSAVDTETEQKIHASLANLCKGRTTFVVAHRLSTVMNADNIIVIGHGQMIEQGNHEELIKANGKYASLWSKQIWKPKESKAEDEQVFLNDIGIAAATAEMVKADNSAKPLNELDDNNEVEQAHAAKTSEVVPKTPRGHKKEESKLNPIASTFTPRECAPAKATATEAPISEPSKPKDNLANLKAAFDEPTTTGDTVKAQSSSGASEGSEDTAVDLLQCADTKGKSASGKVTWKRPRYSRRIQSKSEPFGAGSGSGSGSGAGNQEQ